MSEDPEGFLTRWSRRKRAADVAPPDVEAAPAAEPSPPPAQEPAHEPLPTLAQEPQEPEPELELPSLDDLTAQSDLLAFMREGVPEALKRAAMQKMWTLDPAIRDYIGPADYAWDFNNPETIPGFGPMRPIDDVEKLLRQAVGMVDANEEESVEGHDPATVAPTFEPDPPASAPPAEAVIEHPAESEEGISQQIPTADAQRDDAVAETTAALTQPQPTKSRSTADLHPPRRHGGAIPM